MKTSHTSFRRRTPARRDRARDDPSPEVVIADEPTGNLDPFHTFEIIKLLEKINQLGTTVVWHAHKEVINNLERRVITLDKAV